MFGSDPKADFSIHKQFTKKDFETIDKSKEVCSPGYVYTDVFGKKTVYGDGDKALSSDVDYSDIIKRVTEEVTKNLKR